MPGPLVPNVGSPSKKKHRVRVATLWESAGATYSPTDTEGVSGFAIFGNDNEIYTGTNPGGAYLPATPGGDILPVHFLEIPSSLNLDHCVISVALVVEAITPDPFTDLSGLATAGFSVWLHTASLRGIRLGAARDLLPVMEDGATMHMGKFNAMAGAGGGGIQTQTTHPWPPFHGPIRASTTTDISNFTPHLPTGFFTNSGVVSSGDRLMASFEISTGAAIPSISGQSKMFLRCGFQAGQWGAGDAPTSMTLSGKIVATLYERRGDNK